MDPLRPGEHRRHARAAEGLVDGPGFVFVPRGPRHNQLHPFEPRHHGRRMKPPPAIDDDDRAGGGRRRTAVSAARQTAVPMARQAAVPMARQAAVPTARQAGIHAPGRHAPGQHVPGQPAGDRKGQRRRPRGLVGTDPLDEAAAADTAGGEQPVERPKPARNDLAGLRIPGMNARPTSIQITSTQPTSIQKADRCHRKASDRFVYFCTLPVADPAVNHPIDGKPAHVPLPADFPRFTGGAAGWRLECRDASASSHA